MLGLGLGIAPKEVESDVKTGGRETLPVEIRSPQTGDALIFDSLKSVWKNKPVDELTIELIDGGNF